MATATRTAYVEAFGEAQAAALEAAAAMHKNGIHDEQGSDPFRWAVAIAIGYECVEKYADSHDITVTQDQFLVWVREHGDLEHHDGDSDVLALFTGVYQKYMPKFDEVAS
jgi:hypothetical protein